MCHLCLLVFFFSGNTGALPLVGGGGGHVPTAAGVALAVGIPWEEEARRGGEGRDACMNNHISWTRFGYICIQSLGGWLHSLLLASCFQIRGLVECTASPKQCADSDSHYLHYD